MKRRPGIFDPWRQAASEPTAAPQPPSGEKAQTVIVKGKRVTLEVSLPAGESLSEKLAAALVQLGMEHPAPTSEAAALELLRASREPAKATLLQQLGIKPVRNIH